MKLSNNKFTIVLLALTLVFCLLLMSQCKPENKVTKWRYEIHGYVMYKGKPHEAIWFTDTLEFGDNYLRYENTDGTEVVIPSPFVLIDHKYDSTVENFRHPIR